LLASSLGFRSWISTQSLTKNTRTLRVRENTALRRVCIDEPTGTCRKTSVDVAMVESRRREHLGTGLYRRPSCSSHYRTIVISVSRMEGIRNHASYGILGRPRNDRWVSPRPSSSRREAPSGSGTNSHFLRVF